MTHDDTPQPLDPKALHVEDRQRLQQMMRSREFRLIVDRMGLLLQHWTQQLGNPHNTREVDLCLKGQTLAMKQLLKFCCDVAQLPDLFPKLTPGALDTSRWDTAEIVPESLEPPSGVSPYADRRHGYPA